MANVGMHHLVFAPVTAEENNTITYGAGIVAPHARRGDVTWENAEGEFYGDNMLAEYESDVTGYTAEVETTEMEPEVELLLGLIRDVSGTGESAPKVYTGKAVASTPVGWGFVQTRIIDSVRSFRGWWFYKTTFRKGNMNSKTKEKQIEWGAPTISGKGWGVLLDETGEERFYEFQDFTTPAAAETWLDGKGNVSEG